MNKNIIVTGITGQDGAYLAQHLLNLGYKVFGTFRRSSATNFWRIKELNIFDHQNLELIEFDLTDLSSSLRMINAINPIEIYNLAAQSFVGVSFEQPITTSEITGLGPLNILEAIRLSNKPIKFYQASTSEMYGKVQEIPQKENTPFYPRSPYGVAKLFAHWMTINYRESHNIFATSGILFNHESPIRGEEFVTRKITSTVAKIVTGTDCVLELGNLDAKRDWGYAKDFVEGMYLMMQSSTPNSYVLATNRTETVRYFVELAFKNAGIEILWEGNGINEVGKNKLNGNILVKINEKFYRPAEVDILVGDYSKAKKDLNWVPKTSLEDLCKIMVEFDIKRFKSQSTSLL